MTKDFKVKPKFVLATLLTSCLLTATAADLSLCYEDVDVYPWGYGKHEGLDHYLLQTVTNRLKIDIEYRPRPWKRCQYEVRNGISDGMFSASFTAERQQYAVYPTLPNGEPDPSYRMARDDYRIYRRIGSAMDWQNMRMIHIKKIGIQAGYSIYSELLAAGYTLEDSSKNVSDLMRKLDAGIVDVVITLQGPAQHTLQTLPHLANRIEQLPIPYKVNNLYLPLSKSYCQKQAERCQALWQEIRNIRETAQYQSMLKAHGF
jgi:polar amino acid transport system substrate-binding protein